MTLQDYITQLNSDTVLTSVCCNNIRQIANDASTSIETIKDIFSIAELVDFDNSPDEIKRVIISTCLNYLLDDNETSEANNEIDWIELALGDEFVENIDLADLPTQTRKDILLAIDSAAQNILSQDLIDAINVAKQ